MYLLYIYITIVSLCFVMSGFRKVSRASGLWIYFLLVLLFEFDMILHQPTPLIYKYSPIFLTIALMLYYLKSIEPKFKLYLWILGVAGVVLSIIFVAVSEEQFSNNAGLVKALATISFCLLWFFSQLAMPNNTPIIKKLAFWVSSALLLWSIFFIFRLMPRYLLNTQDKNFLAQIRIAFQYFTLLAYATMLGGLIFTKE